MNAAPASPEGVRAATSAGSDFLERALLLAGARKSDLISLAGPDALPAMLRLCQLGYEEAECAWRATSVLADRPRDLLLLAGRMDAELLGQTVRRTGRLLRDGGLLVAQLWRPQDAAAIAPALAALGRSGEAFCSEPGAVGLRAVRLAAPMALAQRAGRL